MKRKIAVFTGTRAEYGLLYQLIKKIDQADNLSLILLASGSHLSHEFGYTLNEIETDGFIIDEKIEILLSSNSAVGVAKSMGLGLISYSEALDRQQPDAIVILGDRYEALAMAQAALLLKVPILHIHGGEITQGAYDDAMRHAITKMSYLHFTSSARHRDRVIQLGELPQNVFNVGAVGLDVLKKEAKLTKEELSEALSFDFESNFALVTYHPVSLGDESALEVGLNIINSLLNSTSLHLLITYPNADNGGRELIALIDSLKNKFSNRICVSPSLGHKLFASALANCELMIGNSSSGIIEAPLFDKPSVNVGLRQLGRDSAISVIHSDSTEQAITTAINSAIKFKKNLQGHVFNPYGAGNTSQKIVDKLNDLDKYLANFPLKTFYDIEVKRDNNHC